MEIRVNSETGLDPIFGPGSLVGGNIAVKNDEVAHLTRLSVSLEGRCSCDGQKPMILLRQERQVRTEGTGTRIGEETTWPFTFSIPSEPLPPSFAPPSARDTSSKRATGTTICYTLMATAVTQKTVRKVQHACADLTFRPLFLRRPARSTSVVRFPPGRLFAPKSATDFLRNLQLSQPAARYQALIKLPNVLWHGQADRISFAVKGLNMSPDAMTEHDLDLQDVFLTLQSVTYDEIAGKTVRETGSISISPDARLSMEGSALKLAREIGLQSFLIDDGLHIPDFEIKTPRLKHEHQLDVLAVLKHRKSGRLLQTRCEHPIKVLPRTRASAYAGQTERSVGLASFGSSRPRRSRHEAPPPEYARRSDDNNDPPPPYTG